MKSLLIIWFTVLITLVGGTVYMNHAINNLVEQLPDEHTSVLKPVTSLEVQNSDPNSLQPSQILYEDDIIPAWVITPTMIDNKLQPMKHYTFIQGTQTANAIQGSFNQ